MHGYNGKYLHVDLTSGKTEVVELAQSMLKSYLGGVGLGVRLLFEYSEAGIEPLSPQNPLIFASSGLAGTMVPTSAKHAVVAKSPLTGLVGDSLSTSFWSLALKLAGYDALVITGAAPELTYLFIDDDIVHLRSAKHLAGKSTYETMDTIRRRIGDERVRVAAIGPAGEKLVRYASIANDNYRHAGRTGLGAVMGSKNLKAIALRGTGTVKVADLARLEAISQDLYQKAQTAATEKYRELGTLSNVLTLNRLAAMPTRNFQSSVFEGADKISGEYLLAHYRPRVAACAACPIACEHVFQLCEGPHAGTKVRVEYESLYALGPLCGVDDAQAIIRACDLCNSYGMDTLSTGGCIAWAMECYERGLFSKEDTGDIELVFGNGEAMLAMIHQIGKNEGLGRLLSQGVRQASAEVGQGSEYWAMHSKGLEIPGYDPRSMKTMALGYATGLRGACHNRSAAYEVDMMPDIDRLKGERDRGALAVVKENFAAVLDSLIICKFMRRCFDAFYEDVARIYSLVTGVEFSRSDIVLVGERANNLKKVFNIREGWKPEDDWLPPRVFHDPLPEGVARGVVLTEKELREMIEGYYQARGWTKEGFVPEAKLRELGMEEVAIKMKNMVTRR